MKGKSLQETVGERIVMDELHCPENIFVDMALMKDFFIGTILDFISKGINAASEYKYVIDNIAKLSVRYIDDVGYLLPDLKISEIALAAHRIKANHMDIFSGSPATSFVSTFAEYIMNVNNNASVAQNYTMSKLTFSTYPLVIPKEVRYAIASEFEMTYGMSVTITSKALTQLDPEQVRAFDVMFIYDTKKFIENPIYKEDLVKEVFFGKRIYARKEIRSLDVFDVHKTNEDIEKDFLVSEAFLSFVCDFFFLPPSVVSIND